MSLENRDSQLALAGKLLKAASWLCVPLFVLMVVALYGAFLYAPTERVMGEVQRIFYFHVAAAMNSFLAFFIVFIAGVFYLWKRKRIWDVLAVSAVESGVMLTIIVLTTGPIWARPVWNTWFPWGDPRVMTELVLLLIFIAYLILRGTLPEGEKKYKFAAVFGIIGFLDVPIVYFSVHFFRTIHPVVIKGSSIGLETKMYQAWIVAIIAWILLMSVLIMFRMAMRIHDHVSREVEQAVREKGRDR
jgi:heme exporter protein C